MQNPIPPPLVTAFAALVIGFGVPLIQAQSFTFSGQSLIAWGLFAAAVGIMGIAIGQFKRRKTTVNPLQPDMATSLVTSGIFSMTRNPMYLAMALMLLAQSVWLGRILAVIPLAVFIAYITEFQIKPEERALRSVFGEAYTHYVTKVRRWI